MCGISGFYDTNCFNGLDPEKISNDMANSLSHRGPDDFGHWIDKNRGIALSHRRLSILDLSSAGHQPMLSKSNRYMIVYNGEIYNHNELREELSTKWLGNSDTETLLECIERWGIKDTLTKIKGMFSFAIWDKKEALLTLVRDRIGEKPLYYGWQQSSFIFASELRAFKYHPYFNSKINKDVLALYFKHKYVPAPYSIYTNIYKLEPGHFLQISEKNHSVQITKYWSLIDTAIKGRNNLFIGKEQEAINTLDNLLQSKVKEQMLSDVPLGVLLSGGVDSTTIAAVAQLQSSHKIKTFTIGFDDSNYDESIHAKKIANYLNTDHNELIINGKNALDIINNISSIYDEPFSDPSQIPTFILMEYAKKNVTVALTGDAGDEIFSGYNRYLIGPKIWDIIKWIPIPIRKLFGIFLSNFPNNLNLNPFINFNNNNKFGDKINKLGNLLKYTTTQNSLYINLVLEWSDSLKLVLNSNYINTKLTDIEYFPFINDFSSRMMIMDSITYLPDDILVKVDRASMAVSLETRTPFLDPDIIEFAWTLPSTMKIRENENKWILRRVLDQYLPTELLDRPKMGFGIPLNQWLKGPLKDWAENLITVDKIKKYNYLNSEVVKNIWKEFLNGNNSYTSLLWSILMFQAWIEKNS